jgi:2'-5' RNA ligase
MRTIKQLMLEITGELKFSGILKLKPDSGTISSLAKLTENLPPDAQMLEEKHLHVTLIHQNILKPFRQAIKSVDLTMLEVPEIVVTDKVYKLERPNRTSWITVLANQEAMQEFVNTFMQSIGGAVNPEKRIYHITLANLTGKPNDSVGDVQKRDIVGANLVSNVLQDCDNSVK